MAGDEPMVLFFPIPRLGGYISALCLCSTAKNNVGEEAYDDQKKTDHQALVADRIRECGDGQYQNANEQYDGSQVFSDSFHCEYVRFICFRFYLCK